MSKVYLKLSYFSEECKGANDKQLIAKVVKRDRGGATLEYKLNGSTQYKYIANKDFSESPHILPTL